MKINLKTNEYELLLSSKFIPKELKEIILKCEKKDNYSFILNIEEDLADEIREKLSDQLQMEGLGPNDEVNKNGIIIDNLIDKFFTG